MTNRPIFGFGISPRQLRTVGAVVTVCVMPLLGSCSGSDSGTTTTEPGNDTVTQAVGAGGGTVVTPSGAAGVQIPAGTFGQQVMVTITRLPAPSSPGAGPLPSSLKQYGPYYDFTTSPQVAQFGDSARVGVCQVTDPSSAFYPPEPHDNLRLAHTVGNSIEILDRVGVNDFLRCTNVSASIAPSGGWRTALLALARRVIGGVTPVSLYAAHGGLGGKVKSFSPFGAVDPLSGPVQTVEISPAAQTLTAGRSIDLTAVLKDASGNVLPNRVVAWSTSDTTLATISPTGVIATVVGVMPGGPVTVTATSEGKTASLALSLERAANAPNREPGQRLAQLEVSNFNGCGLSASGTAYCWGANTVGQLGDGTTTQREIPTAVQMPVGVTFTTITAFGRSGPQLSHTCALTSGGAAYCWGDQGFGVGVGDGTSSARTVPTPVTMPSGVTLKSISAGGSHTCALTPAGTAYCWGLNSFGNLGTGGFSSSLIPVPVAMPQGVTFSAISAGYFHTCAITSAGALYCWGHNANGEIGNGDTTQFVSAPSLVPLPSGTIVTAVTTGWLFTCALTSGSQVYCWGANLSGRLGDGTTTERHTPVAVVMPAGVTFSAIDIGNTHTCAISTSGSAYCWGDNSAGSQLATPGGVGALGDGTTIDRFVPTAVLMPMGVKFTSISTGSSFSCALDGTGARYCWGANNSGQRGDGTTTP
jgi:alpha-tubulin suppressor-like RCC1 family protein